MPLFGAGPREPLGRIEELSGEPEAPRWARECGWVPGTGHCRKRNCADACIFRAQRETDAARVQRWRRLRRIFLRRRVR